MNPIPINSVFQNVRTKVLKASKNKQCPTDSNSLRQELRLSQSRSMATQQVTEFVSTVPYDDSYVIYTYTHTHTHTSMTIHILIHIQTQTRITHIPLSIYIYIYTYTYT